MWPLWSFAGRKVKDKCIEELAQFKIDRSSNINKDIPLGEMLSIYLAEEAPALTHMGTRVHDRSPGVQRRCPQSLQGCHGHFPRQCASLPQVSYRGDLCHAMPCMNVLLES